MPIGPSCLIRTLSRFFNPRISTKASMPGKEELMMTTTAALGVALLVQALGTEARMDTGRNASGTFEVKVTPAADEDKGIASARMSLAKTFSGDLAGTSSGEMWTTQTAVEGSAGYVAIERVSATLNGRIGSFTLIHQGTMRRGGDLQLRIVVVPDSGTE